jgi:hypothetical protein
VPRRRSPVYAIRHTGIRDVKIAATLARAGEGGVDEAQPSSPMSDHRRALLTAALGFSLLEARAPELAMLHAWLDSWTGVGLVVEGLGR